MDERELFIELEEPVRRIISGINAIELMVLGLSRARDPYADGLHMVWDYLQEAGRDMEHVLNEQGPQHVQNEG